MRTSFVLFGLTILAGINGSASLTLTVNNPNQIVVPGAHAVYSGTLTNTDSVAYTVVLFSAINPPTDATTPPTTSQLFPIAEPAVPFNIAAGGQVAGVIMDITVPATAQLRNHSFAVEAVTSSHDTAGNSIVSNFAVLNLTVALPNSYQLLTTIPIPGNLTGGFDISWVDTAGGRYYLADRGTGSVDVIDAERDQYLYSIGGFVGSKGRGVSGPDGVLVIHKEHELWAGDGDSTVKVVDLKAGANAVPFAISTGGTKRADELAYDPIDHITSSLPTTVTTRPLSRLSPRRPGRSWANSRIRKRPAASSSRFGTSGPKSSICRCRPQPPTRRARSTRSTLTRG